MDSIHQARLAQSVEHQTLNRRVVGSSPTVDKEFFILYFVASDALLAGRIYFYIYFILFFIDG